jgi:hypothetical protein
VVVHLRTMELALCIALTFSMYGRAKASDFCSVLEQLRQSAHKGFQDLQGHKEIVGVYRSKLTLPNANSDDCSVFTDGPNDPKPSFECSWYFDAEVTKLAQTKVLATAAIACFSGWNHVSDRGSSYFAYIGPDGKDSSVDRGPVKITIKTVKDSPTINMEVAYRREDDK